MAINRFNSTTMLITEYVPNISMPQNLVNALMPSSSKLSRSTSPNTAQNSVWAVSNKLTKEYRSCPNDFSALINLIFLKSHLIYNFPRFLLYRLVKKFVDCRERHDKSHSLFSVQYIANRSYITEIDFSLNLPTQYSWKIFTSKISISKVLLIAI